MKSKNTFITASAKTLKPQQSWTLNLKQQLQNIKKPFLNRVQFSKLRIQSRIENQKKQNQALLKYQSIIQCLIQKLLQNQLPTPNQQESIRQSSQQQQSQKQISLLKPRIIHFDDQSQDQKQNSVNVSSYLTQWPGRNKQRLFKNSTNMIQQYQKIFTKKTGTNHLKKKNSYSYRKDQKDMLQRIYNELKHEKQNYVQFKKLYKFFQDCKLFLRIYGISPSQLHDVVACSAHKYPDRLTKDEFFQLFLVNSQSRNYEEIDNKINKVCCLDQQNWNQLKKLFNMIDTFGKGEVNTSEFFHKMKTISVSKQLLEAKSIQFVAVNRFYNFQKILFVLEHKKKLPQTLTWSELQCQITNFQYIEFPTLDQIFIDHIKKGFIIKGSNAFLLHDQILLALKQQFQRCPKFNQHFVKGKYFCQQILSLKCVKDKLKQYVRPNPVGKGYVNLQTTIKLLQNQGLQYFDLDQMLSYFSVKGFQKQANQVVFKDSFDTKSTTSSQEFQQKKKKQKREKRMKSLDQMQKIMRKTTQSSKYQNTENRKAIFKPTKIEEFNLTKLRDNLTIREKRLNQMLNQNERKQKEQIKPFVRANPIPASINCQRYQEQQQKQELRRQVQRDKIQKQRQQDERKLVYLMSNTKLFHKKDPFLEQQQKRMYLSPQPKQQFQAKPISWFIKQKKLLQIFESQKQQKRKNRLKETKEKYVFGYWKNMPYEDKSKFGKSNIKKLTIAQKLENNKNDSDNGNDSLQLQIQQIKSSLDKKRKNKIDTTIVPDFVRLQKQFTMQLQSKKKMRSPTVVKQFNLSEKNKRKTEIQEIEMLQRIKIQQSEKKDLKESIQVKTSLCSPKFTVGTTKKFQCMVELTQKRIEEKRKESQQKKMQQKQRRRKQKIFAKFMKQAMIQNMKQEGLKSKNHKNPSQITTHRQNQKKQSQNVSHQLQLKKIYQRVLSRPFLFQQPSTGSKRQQQITINKIMKSNHKSNKTNKTKIQPKKVWIPSQKDQKNIKNIKIPQLSNLQDFQQSYQQQNEFNVEQHEMREQDLREWYGQNGKESKEDPNKFVGKYAKNGEDSDDLQQIGDFECYDQQENDELQKQEENEEWEEDNGEDEWQRKESYGERVNLNQSF